MLKIFSSQASPTEVITALKSFVDEEEVDPSSRILFRGNRPVVGRFSGHAFRLRRRVSYPWWVWWLTPGRWFKPQINGWVTIQNGGSRIQLEGGISWISKVLWVLLFLGATGLIAAWTVFTYPYNLSHDPVHSGNNFLRGILALNVVAAILIILPVIGWLLTRDDLSTLLRQFQQHLHVQESE
ncbi:MAG: hypothetical protein JOY96_09970 [Verrucomicrobia bacterium]|nr:hypothetical protein [Verrucomicrobiota bacterium]MBV9671882.1 hypothetical protein [Verrucomicrobiota bacterium]